MKCSIQKGQQATFNLTTRFFKRYYQVDTLSDHDLTPTSTMSFTTLVLPTSHNRPILLAGDAWVSSLGCESGNLPPPN